MLEMIEGRRKGASEDEMVGWHHPLNGHEFEQTLEDSEGQGSLACCDSWGRKESDTTERLNSTELRCVFCVCVCVCFLPVMLPSEFP